MSNLNYRGPVVLVILDGVGLRDEKAGNALLNARLSFLNSAVKKYLHVPLEASGEAVGILPGTMGNSEVGHNAIGSGQIIKQGIANIEESFQTGEIWQSKAWTGAIENIKKSCTDATLHFAGIFSDGKVHSDIRHLEKMVTQAYKEGVRKIRLHLVLDGRDVSPQSALEYVQRTEEFFATFAEADYKIASGGGRMVFVADRYESDWSVVKNGWDAMVHGRASYQFTNATEAIEYFRSQDAEIQDQYIPPFVIVNDGAPVGKVENGDSFIYYDFRADRAIEIAMAFTYRDFPYFDRGDRPEVFFAGMTEYNSDTHVPEYQLVPPVKISEPLNVFLGEHDISQLAISETVKFGHITYYFNGNSYAKAPKETHIEIASDALPFNTRPWMKAAEITDYVLENMEKYRFVRLNFPGGDMVGHFAELESTVVALEAIDLQLSRLATKVDELGGMMIITADHGNAEELLDERGEPKTSHTTNPVPCIFYDNTENKNRYQLANLSDVGMTKTAETETNPELGAGLSNLASTIAFLLDLPDYPDSWRPSLLVKIESEK